MPKILLIEDESALQKALGNYLEMEGYEMISALDGSAGLELAEKEKPDLILLDLILPKMSGLEVLKKLKENSSTQTIPVIVLTNLGEVGYINETLKAGVDGIKAYLVKTDFTLEEVVEKIKQALKG